MQLDRENFPQKSVQRGNLSGALLLYRAEVGVKLRSSSETTIALLAQYKSFLDQGVITQDEFNAKKKQLLGL